jgi:hypothetical protein
LGEGFLKDCIILTLTFATAEGLTRKAFPNHVQLWRSASPGVANTHQIFFLTFGGYLLVGLFLSYDIAFYGFSIKELGWWASPDVNFDSYLFTNYLPWFSPIVDSFEAGFSEECLFRAIPLAGAALIGEKFGHRRAWIVFGLVIQAIIFGSVHTAYNTQPGYFRLVEILIPSLLFGIIYLIFGLIPIIISHFLFDAVLMSLPLLYGSTPGSQIDRLFVIALCLLPILIIFFRRIQCGIWENLNEKNYNSGWHPPLKKETLIY